MEQEANALLSGGYHVEPGEYRSMKYSDFKSRLDNNGLKDENTSALEDMFWNEENMGNIYSLDNMISLFDDSIQTWNLNKFTNRHSNIHSAAVHQNLKVSTFVIQEPVVC